MKVTADGLRLDIPRERSTGFYLNEDPSSKLAVASGYAPDDIILSGLVFYAPLYRFQALKFNSVDPYKHLCTRTEGTWGTQGITMDGTNDFIDVGNPTVLQITGAITVGAWIKTTSLNRTLAKWATTGNQRQFELQTRYWVITTNGITEIYREYGTLVRDGAWHHLVGTFYPSTNLDIYIDGALDNGALGGVIPATLFNSSANVYIGRMEASYYTGIVDQVMIYNRMLTAGEIAHIYNTTKGRYL